MNNKTTLLIAILLLLSFIFGALVGGLVIYQRMNPINTKLTEDINNVKKQLKDKTEELTESQIQLLNFKNELVKMQENCKIVNQKNLDLNEDLITSHAIIDAMKCEMYSVEYAISENEITMIAKTIWGEARGLSVFEQSLVVWCILNRVDNGYWGDTVAEVITYPNQFHGYNSNYPAEDEFVAIAKDVVARWQVEKHCSGDVGRTLPSKYLYFHAENNHNIFKTNYIQPYEVYDWSNSIDPYI